MMTEDVKIGADLQGLKIPRPPNPISKASITPSELLGRWRQSLGKKKTIV